MKPTKKIPTPGAEGAPPPVDKRVHSVVASLKALGSARERANLARYGITAHGALGVSMANIQRLAKTLGHDHELAVALWETNCYEARLLVAFVAEPERVTAARMERWCRDFDNWAVCDTLCFHLFDRVPHAWSKIRKWSRAREEFTKRTAFALLASIAGHDAEAKDALFLEGLRLIEGAASDERNFVKKGVSWALRRIGRRNRALNEAAVALSQRLAVATDPTERWLGRSSLKELTSASVQRALAKTKRSLNG